jgi:hypothetical protein
LAMPFMVGFRVGRVSVIYTYTHGVKQFWSCVNVCDGVSVNELCFGKEVSSMGYIQYISSSKVLLRASIVLWLVQFVLQNHDKCILFTIKIGITQPKLFLNINFQKNPYCLGPLFWTHGFNLNFLNPKPSKFVYSISFFIIFFFFAFFIFSFCFCIY